MSTDVGKLRCRIVQVTLYYNMPVMFIVSVKVTKLQKETLKHGKHKFP